jgi:CheY-like chemotaxis protein
MDVVVDNDFANSHPGLSAGKHVKLEVSDTGCGIPYNLLERIYDPFFTTKEKGGGTGLGLSTVHGIVKGLKGAISVYSEEGKGTRFSIFLPAHSGEDSKEGFTVPELPTGNERILLVDDEASLVDVGKTQLKSLGYKVSTRTSPLEALALFQKRPLQYDLVITDLTMPKMTGLDLAREIIQIRSDIPIILCSGFSAFIDDNQLLSAGVKRLIKKPILLGEFATAIREVLDKSGTSKP